MGDPPDSANSSAISYIASTCQQHNATGLCIGDVLLADPSNPATGQGSGEFADDTGDGSALETWAAAQQQQNATDAANLGIQIGARSLFAGNIPSPLPGLGLTVPIPKPWLWIGGGLVALALLSGGKSR
jgi:hypothetical protein